MAIDACGLSCPEPVLMTAKEMEKAVPLINVKVDNQTAVENITRLATNKNYTIAVKQEEGGYLLTLRSQAAPKK